MKISIFNKKVRIIYVFILAFTILFSCFVQINAKAIYKQNGVDPWVMNERIGKGINLKSQITPNDPSWWIAWNPKLPFLVKEAGFNSVRLWIYPMRNAQGMKLESDFFDSLDRAINDCLSQQLVVVLTMKNHKEFINEPDSYKSHFLSFWAQIANHYKNYSANLIFDILNEPYGNLNSTIWNQWIADVVPTIRKTNPNRNLIIGSAGYSNWRQLVNNLKLPASDNHIIAQLHYYKPLNFTHQGINGRKKGLLWGTEKDYKELSTIFQQVYQWSKKQNKPIYLGEFGANNFVPENLRLKWLKAVLAEASSKGFSWSYYSFGKAGHPWAIYNPNQRKWEEPITSVLLPNKNYNSEVKNKVN
ncbi:glycoside hydrolase family 5 protein [Gloeocapsopsis crepidinum LEGE 06123]|uniref:Glycoside hydrolase family 5 protein n=1 Tax=Gloeocapsopsis crepidinum LEGE 06123 TaxID=588587 RepID=A0ABR9UW01_9CHRO|nr:glycoside hydrolase family 5 protein [Gloeocapsopsis crepidinum]MBE9192480.1 glycoside hydrolase family 5 protein [Gloeocapsopsis crepidinum LEGE 06123]